MHFGMDTLTNPLAPKSLTKQEFGKRLYRLMMAKGWRQSELARQADLPRDSVSTYIRGKTLPTPLSLQKLADALGVASEELLPNVVEGAIDEDIPSLEMKVSPNAPETAWLRVNRAVSLKTALEIMRLLEEDHVFDGTRNGGTPSVQHDEDKAS
jgi:transcriptional regulator with XRE-family HTH domain